MENIFNKTMAFFNITDIADLHFTMALHCWVILPIALPLVCVAIYGLISMIKTDHVAPVYVINLLFSDVLVICTKPIALSISPAGLVYELMAFVYSMGLLASTVFMVCIAGERYVMIVHPLWYRFHRTITKSVLCSLTVWMATLVTIGSVVLASIAEIINIETVFVSLCIVCLLPYPFVIFFFVGSWKALSKSMSVSPHGQQRIMGTLALVLFIYTVFFMPYIVITLVMKNSPGLFNNTIFQKLAVTSSTLLSLNPLADPILYVFMAKKTLFVLPCCCCRHCGHKKQPEHRDTEIFHHLSSTITGETHV